MNTATSMPAVTPFCFKDCLIRTVTIDNDPWFVAKDVCAAIGLDNPTKALLKVPEKHKGLNRIQGKRGEYDVNIVSEPGLYRLVLRSDKPEAEPFMEWVTAEVLPAIRKTGGYQMPSQDKTVQMRHTVIRGSNAPGGLDIRYTLDLGKIVANPTRRGVELLERLTGIQLSDIPVSEDEGERAVELVQGFLAERCRFKPGSTVLFASVYAAYRQHCGLAGDVLPSQIVSRMRMSKLLTAGGFTCQKVGGQTRLIDTALVCGEEVASC